MTREDELYDRVKQLEQDWLSDEVQKRVISAISPSLLRARDPTDAQDQSSERRAAGEKFLTVLKEAWEDHQLCMSMITDVLMYMVCGIGNCTLGRWAHGLEFADCVGSESQGLSQTVHIRCGHGAVPRFRAAVSHYRGVEG